jgi:hypothetical protein
MDVSAELHRSRLAELKLTNEVGLRSVAEFW